MIFLFKQVQLLERALLHVKGCLCVGGVGACCLDMPERHKVHVRYFVLCCLLFLLIFLLVVSLFFHAHHIMYAHVSFLE